jgi:hypothetical protein
VLRSMRVLSWHPSARSTLAVLSLALPLGLAACSSGVPNPNTGAVVVAVPVRSLRVPRTGNFDARRVEPAFSAALAAYTAHLWRLELTTEASEGQDIRRALDLLADAIERAPGAREDRRIPRAIELLHETGARMEVGVLWDRRSAADVEDGLILGASALGQLARGPFRRDRVVVGRAAALDDTVHLIRDAERLRPRRQDVYDALHKAALVMTAMHTAVARGEVVVLAP